MTEWVYRAARDRLAEYALQAISIASRVEPVAAQSVSADAALSPGEGAAASAQLADRVGASLVA